MNLNDVILYKGSLGRVIEHYPNDYFYNYVLQFDDGSTLAFTKDHYLVLEDLITQACLKEIYETF